MTCIHCDPNRPATSPLGGDHPSHDAEIRLLACCSEEVAFADCGCHLTVEDDGDVALFPCDRHSETFNSA